MTRGSGKGDGPRDGPAQQGGHSQRARRPPPCRGTTRPPASLYGAGVAPPPPFTDPRLPYSMAAPSGAPRLRSPVATPLSARPHPRGRRGGMG